MPVVQVSRQETDGLLVKAQEEPFQAAGSSPFHGCPLTPRQYDSHDMIPLLPVTVLHSVPAPQTGAAECYMEGLAVGCYMEGLYDVTWRGCMMLHGWAA